MFAVRLAGVWSSADAGLDPFRLDAPAEYNIDARPNQSYDFTQTYLNSDLDVSRLEIELGASYEFGERFWVDAAYRYLELEDDAPYLVDVSGDVDVYAVGFGTRF